MKKAIFLIMLLLIIVITTAWTYDDAENKTHIVAPEQQSYGSMKTYFVDQIVEEVNTGDGASTVYSLITPSATLWSYPQTYVLGRVGFDYLECGQYMSCSRAYILVNTPNGYERAMIIDGSTRTIIIKEGWRLIYE